MRNKSNKSKKSKKNRKVKNTTKKRHLHRKTKKGGYQGTTPQRTITPNYIEIQFKGIPRDALTGGITMLSDTMINEVKIGLKKDLKEFFIPKALDNCRDEVGNNGCPTENNIKVSIIKYDKERYTYTIQFKIMCVGCLDSDYEFLKDELTTATKTFYYNNTDYKFSVSF